MSQYQYWIITKDIIESKYSENAPSIAIHTSYLNHVGCFIKSHIYVASAHKMP